MSPREAVVGVSLEMEDATRAVGIGPGPVKVVGAFFAMHAFKKGGDKFPCLMLEYTRGGEKLPAEPYSVGQGWKVSEDQQALIPRASQTGLPENCKTMHLIRSLRECGMPKGYFKQPEALVGVEGVLIVKEMETIKAKKAGQSDTTPTVLVFESVDEAPWDEGGGKKKAKGGKAKPAADDDDEDDDDEDDDADEAPVRGKKSKKSADDDEDEKPAKGKKKKPAADDDDEDDAPADTSDDQEEVAAEALVTVLEEGALKQGDIEDAVRAEVKKRKDADEIAELAASPAFLKKQLGWKYDTTKKRASL